VAEGYHPPVEEYLEAIFGLAEEGVPVIQARLVERLGISPQAVSEMVHRLAGEGYLEPTKRSVVLTAQGQERARSVVRRHRLAERFLVDIVGLPWHEAHREAGKWEHVISDAVELRFIELLGHPTTCPHGSPIPGSGALLGPQVQLASIGLGKTVHLARITEQIETDEDALIFLSNNGLVPGADATVVDRAPDGTLTLELEGESMRSVSVGPAMARQIFVAAGELAEL
jgi:DtxR family Mn-dependent transcriptional regulator